MRLPRVEDVEALLPRPESFDDSRRGPATASRVGTALGVAFGICFLTGMWSHLQYEAPTWAPIGPAPRDLYRVTQGLHVATGIASVPLLLVKLWTVYPRLFLRPPRGARRLLVEGLERLSIAVLVAGAIFLLSTGLLNIAQWYPWAFSFRRTHEALAWVTIGALLVHVAVKLPVVREGFSVRPDPGRRQVLGASALAVAAVTLLTAGQTVPWLRRVSVLAVRDGEGPQGLPINRTARAAGVDPDAVGDAFRLEVVSGERAVSLTRDDLARLPQRTHRLTIACVEGWSRSALWTGVAVRDLVALVGADPSSTVRVTSLQRRGAFGTSELPADFVADAQTLLALELDGTTLDLDHGYPCRVIAPNRPGVLQTKWVTRLEVVT